MSLTPLRAVILLLGLVSVSTGRALSNGFALDDVPIVADNGQVHRLAPPWVYARQSYWPPRNEGDAYRPWTVWWFAIQYAVGGGAPWVFHLGNSILTVALTIAVFALLRPLVPIGAAVAGAGIFAVHPVHVEATANVVGQAELWMTLFVTLAVWLYRRARRTGPLGPRTVVLLAGLYFLASASKEQGIMLPGLLLASELLPWPGAVRVGARRLAPTYAVLAGAGAAFLFGRWLVLEDLGGGPLAAGLQGHTAPQRVLIMLPLVLEWARLLVWPSALAAHYSIPAFGAAPGWTLGTWLGLGVAIGVAILTVASARRAPVIGWGLAWAAIAILPVSNVPFATGILVAERTLMLPSVGVALLVGGLASLAPRRAAPIVAGAVAILVLLGAARSWSRQAVWLNSDTVFEQSLRDGPRSYLNYAYYARDLLGRGYWSTDATNPHFARAKTLYAAAAELYPGDPRVFLEWGYILQSERRCDLAAPIFERGLAALPSATGSRNRLVDCLLDLKRYDEVIVVADAGVRGGHPEFAGRLEFARRAKAAGPPVRARHR